MTPKDYIELGQEEMKKILWDKGQYIMNRAIYGKAKINLYMLFDFYVEVYVNIEGSEITGLAVITEDEVLERYIDLREVKLILRDGI